MEARLKNCLGLRRSGFSFCLAPFSTCKGSLKLPEAKANSSFRAWVCRGLGVSECVWFGAMAQKVLAWVDGLLGFGIFGVLQPRLKKVGYDFEV